MSLPATYQQIEYLQSTGTQYIKSGITGNSQAYFCLDWKYDSAPTNNTWAIGVWRSYHDTMIGYYSSKIYFLVGGSGTQNITFDTDRHLYEAGASSLKVDGESVGTPNWSNVPAVEFQIFKDDGHSSATSGRLYSCKIYSGETLVRDFLPCYRISDNEPGLYDLVNDVFYTNEGTGTFVLGPTIVKNVCKVILNNQLLVDLTSDTVTKDNLLSGYTAHDANGGQVTGEYVPQADPVLYFNSGGTHILDTESDYYLAEVCTVCTLSGRTYTKTYADACYCAYFYNSTGYTGPILIGKTLNSVTFNCGSAVMTGSSFTLDNQTWYISSTGYFMGGNCTSTSGFAAKLSSSAMTQDAAKALLVAEMALVDGRFKLTAAGDYDIPTGYDGFADITAEYSTETYTATANGTYTPSEGYVGFGKFIVNVNNEPVIQPLSISANGTYTAPAGVNGYSPIMVNVAGGEGAHIYMHFPRVCVGDERVDFHSDCDLKTGLSLTNAECDDAITLLERTDELDGYINIDQDEITAGDVLTFKMLSSGFTNGNGDSVNASIYINALDYTDLYEVAATSAWCHRKVLYRMTSVRYQEKTDGGADTITFTRSFTRVGGYANSDQSSVILYGDSYAVIGTLTIKVNNRDAAMYSTWKEEGDVQGSHFLKVRWEGMSTYSLGAPDQEYELVFLGNGDVIYHLIKAGSYTDGETSFNGTTFTFDADVPTISFYRNDYYGGSWTVIEEDYNIAHHSSEADLVWHTRVWATESSDITHGAHLIHNTSYDDSSLTYTFEFNFSWHDKTYVVASGNSWIGIGGTSEDIQMHRRDAKMWYLYADYVTLTDMDSLKAFHITWGGASTYSGSIDRWWSLWLFQNGDAMIYISTTGSNTGSCTFYGQTFTATDNTFISFYYNPSNSNYDIYNERYTLDHHVEET